MGSAGAEWTALARQALDEEGRRAGFARNAVVDLLGGEHCCLSAQEIVDRLRADGTRVGTASVYRALDLLQRTGLVQRVEVGEGGARYEAAMPGGEHHHHVVCERCGELTPFEDPVLEREIDRVAASLEHRIAGHEVLLRGVCPRCRRAGR